MPSQPNLWVDGRGFLRYGMANLNVRVVDGVLEFIVKERDFSRLYGRRVLVEVEELASLCNRAIIGSRASSSVRKGEQDV